MANGIKINDLSEATSLNDADVMTIVQDKENKKMPISLLDKDGSYSQSVINTISDLITTSKSNVEITKQAIDDKFGDDKFSAQINTIQEISTIGVNDDGSVDVSSQVQNGFMETAILYGRTQYHDKNSDTYYDSMPEDTTDMDLELVSVKYITHEDGSKLPILTTTNEDRSKTSILSTENDLIMRSSGSIRDSLDLITGKFIQRIDEEGNILSEPIETIIDINTDLGDEKLPIVYKGGHILLESDELTPELQYSIPISYSGLIAQNTMTNLKHSWRLDELELMAYASIVNSQYDSLMLVATAESSDVEISKVYSADESLYQMLKVLVNANALQNADDKIAVFYLYGKLSDEMYLDLNGVDM